MIIINTLLQNSNPSGILFILFCIIPYILADIFYIIKAIKIGILYIADGGNARVPCIISFILIYSMSVILYIVGFITGDFSSEAIIIINLTWVSAITLIFRGRIIGFSSINIKKYTKFILLTISCILNIISVISAVVTYDYHIHTVIYGWTFNEIQLTILSFLTVTMANRWWQSVTIYLPVIITTIFILYFDIKEKASKYALRLDILLFIPSVLYLIFGIFQPYQKYLWILPTLAFMLINIINFIYIRYEIWHIILHTGKINSLIKGTKSLINVIIKKKEYTYNDQFRFQQIYNIICSDEQVRENIFGEITINKKRRNIIKRLKEVYNNHSKLRQNQVLELPILEKRAKK
jgi:hypothetical protein